MNRHTKIHFASRYTYIYVYVHHKTQVVTHNDTTITTAWINGMTITITIKKSLRFRYQSHIIISAHPPNHRCIITHLPMSQHIYLRTVRILILLIKSVFFVEDWSKEMREGVVLSQWHDYSDKLDTHPDGVHRKIINSTDFQAVDCQMYNM